MPFISNCIAIYCLCVKEICSYFQYNDFTNPPKADASTDLQPLGALLRYRCIKKADASLGGRSPISRAPASSRAPSWARPSVEAYTQPRGSPWRTGSPSTLANADARPVIQGAFPGFPAGPQNHRGPARFPGVHPAEPAVLWGQNRQGHCPLWAGRSGCSATEGSPPLGLHHPAEPLQGAPVPELFLRQRPGLFQAGGFPRPSRPSTRPAPPKGPEGLPALPHGAPGRLPPPPGHCQRPRPRGWSMSVIRAAVFRPARAPMGNHGLGQLHRFFQGFS